MAPKCARRLIVGRPSVTSGAIESQSARAVRGPRSDSIRRCAEIPPKDRGASSRGLVAESQARPRGGAVGHYLAHPETERVLPCYQCL